MKELTHRRAMLALARRLGFEVRFVPEDSSVVRVVRPLHRQAAAR